MDILSLRLFLHIARMGGVSRAASALHLSPAAGSARLAKIEADLGVRLFHRTTRAVSLTTDGAGFLPYAESVLETLDEGMSAFGRRGKEPTGTLRMTLPGSFGRMHVVPALGEFCRRYPRVDLDLRLSDEVLDVVAGAYDLIIRNAQLSDSAMIRRRLALDRRILVASPEYLAARGAPRTPSELRGHATVALGDGTRVEFADGTGVHLRESHRLNDGEAMRIAIEAGMGIGVKSVWNAYRSLQSGALVEVLPDHPLATRTAIWALYPAGRLMPQKVRAMIDFLLELFTPIPPWEQPTRPDKSSKRSRKPARTDAPSKPRKRRPRHVARRTT